MKNNRSLFQRFALFEGLTASSLDLLMDEVSWGNVARGNLVLSDKESSDDVFLIAEGAVIARMFSISGKEVHFAKLGRGEIFGEFSAIDRQERSASISTVASSVIGQMRSASLRDLILREPLFALRFCEHLVAKNRQVSQRLFEYAALSVSQRICKELLRLAEDERGRLVIGMLPTHQYLANGLGTHREAVSRELSRLTAQGIVETKGRRVVILDPKALQAMVRD